MFQVLDLTEYDEGKEVGATLKDQMQSLTFFMSSAALFQQSQSVGVSLHFTGEELK